MQAYHGSEELKTRFEGLIEWHRATDKLMQGHGYWEDGKGCAIGCSIQSLNQITGSQYRANDHSAYETLIGVPRLLAKLEDGIFEGLPDDRAQTWPGEFAAAIRPGADLSGIWPRFAHWLLSDVIQFARTDTQRIAIQHIIDLYAQVIEGATISSDTWWNARSTAAGAAAAYVAAAGAYAADAYVAAAGAYAAGAYAADAYVAAADAAAYAAAYTAAYAADARHSARVRQADKLLELLRAA
jgi:ABC-type transport system involved in cytochrome bd biosynthesis fused ATPase/permease subunit